MIETPLHLLQSSSLIFCKHRKMFGHFRLAFGQILEISSESGRKSSQNRHRERLEGKFRISRGHIITSMYSCRKSCQ